tara:strand:- start:715 stop:1023 length:309 start_codon:yes stop_codon:yes gene_type:complete
MNNKTKRVNMSNKTLCDVTLHYRSNESELASKGWKMSVQMYLDLDLSVKKQVFKKYGVTELKRQTVNTPEKAHSIYLKEIALPFYDFRWIEKENNILPMQFH